MVNGLHQRPDVRKAADCRHPHLAGAGNGEHSLLPRLAAANFPEGVRIGIFSRDHVVGAAERRIHHAAGGAEDHRRAGAGAQRAVKLHLR